MGSEVQTDSVNPHSFYVGPGKPVLRATGWDDVVAAAQTGALAETQWVELKVALPASASAPNLELARDLASLSIDGGVLVIGVKDPGNQADHVVGTTDDLEGPKEPDRPGGRWHTRPTSIKRPVRPTNRQPVGPVAVRPDRVGASLGQCPAHGR